MLLLFILSLANYVTVDVKVNSELSWLKAVKDCYLIEDFESWPPGRFTLEPDTGVGSWQQSPVNTNMFISPQTGASRDHGAEFDVWNYSEGTSGDVISDPIDLTGTTSPELSLYFWNHFSLFGKTNDDSTIVSISTDGGSNWNPLMVLKGDVDDWTQYSMSINSYIGDTVRIRFRGISDNGGSNMVIDSVEIGDRPSFDAGVSAILNPEDLYDPDVQIIPTCEITSIGTDTVYDFYTYLEVDSVGIVIYRDSVFVDDIFYGKNDTLQFSTFLLPTCFYYGFTYFTALPGDRYSYNDSLSIITTCYALHKVVIGEIITNTGCPPCQPANDTLDQIFPDYPDNLALIRYHGWWPASNDPFYQYNIPENEARINYYGADYAPHLYLDGNVDCEYYWEFWRDSVEAEIGRPTSLGIKIEGMYDSYTAAGSLYVKVFANTEPSESNLYLRYCLVESEIRYNAPNGQTEFFQTFRDMFPNTIGVPIIIHAGETVVDTQRFTVDNSTIKEKNAEIIVFVQSDDNKHILQGAKIPLPVLAGITEESREKEPLEILSISSVILGKVNNEIKFSLGSTSHINISVYDITGRKRLNLIEGKMNPGIHTFEIDTGELNPGLYFVLFSYDGKRQMRKLVVLY